MDVPLPHGRALGALIVLVALVAPAGALAARRRPQRARPPVTTLGVLTQTPGPDGCAADRSARTRGCTKVRALDGPGPFLGSGAIAVSPDGRNVYVASSRSDAIAVFQRDASSGALTQAAGAAGCVAAGGADGCAPAVGLDGPSSVAVSADGGSVYATARDSDSIVVLRRDGATGALTQATDASGCVAGRAAIPGCATVRALRGPDVVAVSPDGRNVYAGSFTGSAIVTFARDAATGALTQPAGAAGCLVDAPAEGCATGLALREPEGLAISGDGSSVYIASAGSDGVAVLARDGATGTLTQAADGSGCVVSTPLTGCTTGAWLAGADAVAVSPGGDSVYVTSSISDSVASFTRAADGRLAQQSGTSACVIHVLAVGCSLGRAMNAPEGLAVSPDGATVYVAAFGSGAVDVLDRDTTTGALMQKPRRTGCVTARLVPDCLRGRALSGASSVAVSPDGRHVYAAAFRSDAVAVFKRVTRSVTRGQR